MDPMDVVYNTLLHILTGLPVILVMLTGCVLALLRWRQHPKPAMLALIGCLIYLLSSIFFPLIYALLPMLFRGQFQSASNISIIYRATNIAAYLVNAVALSLLIAAIFTGRNSQPNQSERNLAR